MVRNVVLVRLSAEVQPEAFLEREILALARRYRNGSHFPSGNKKFNARGVMDLQIARESTGRCEEAEEEASETRHCVPHHLTPEIKPNREAVSA